MINNPDQLNRLKPGVKETWLYFLAGAVWLGAGILLIKFASRWLITFPVSTLIWLALGGLALATGIYTFGFSRLAKKNITRIGKIDGERICLFAFQEWTSYPLVAFMMSLGIYLRLYSPFPKSLLAVMYLGIGGALSSASLHYFSRILNGK